VYTFLSDLEAGSVGWGRDTCCYRKEWAPVTGSLRASECDLPARDSCRFLLLRVRNFMKKQA